MLAVKMEIFWKVYLQCTIYLQVPKVVGDDHWRVSAEAQECSRYLCHISGSYMYNVHVHVASATYHEGFHASVRFSSKVQLIS